MKINNPTNPAIHPPLPPFKFGAILIPVYRADKIKYGTLYPGFRFKCKLGNTVIEGYKTTLSELRDEADKAIKAYQLGAFACGAKVIVLKGHDLHHYEQLQKIEGQLGGNLLTLLKDEILPAFECLRGAKATLSAAAKDYAARYTGCRAITVHGAITRFLSAKSHISAAQYRRYRRILGYLSDKYGHTQMADLTPIRVKAFLRGLKRQIKRKAQERSLQKQHNQKGTKI